MSVCQCGKGLPVWCGFHPHPDDCLCIGTICSTCLEEALGSKPDDRSRLT